MPHLHFIREGQGPLVVLSHALGCDLHMWDGVAALLATDYSVLRYDHRNHGKSEVTGRQTMDMLAEDAAGLIKAEAAGVPVHFVGLSMGGMTAQALALRNPQLLASLTIANSSAHYPDPTPWRVRVDTVRAQGISAIASGAVARWLTPAYVKTPEGEAAAKALTRTLVGTDPEGYAVSCEAVANIDFRESNQQIEVPTLVIAGVQDEATPPDMSEQIARAVPKAQLVTIDAAHLSAVERPAEFVLLLRQFWTGLGVKASG